MGEALRRARPGCRRGHDRRPPVQPGLHLVLEGRDVEVRTVCVDGNDEFSWVLRHMEVGHAVVSGEAPKQLRRSFQLLDVR